MDEVLATRPRAEPPLPVAFPDADTDAASTLPMDDAAACDVLDVEVEVEVDVADALGPAVLEPPPLPPPPEVVLEVDVF